MCGSLKINNNNNNNINKYNSVTKLILHILNHSQRDVVLCNAIISGYQPSNASCRFEISTVISWKGSNTAGL